MDIDFSRELKIAKKAALEAGNFLRKNKDNLNKTISSTDRDIKIQADIEAEKIIKDIINDGSSFGILAEESGISSDASYNSKDGTSHVGHTISVGCNNGPILAISKRHPTVSTSSAEAELKGFTFCAQNVDWIKNILKSVYRIKNIGTAIIEVDNEPAIKAVIGANLTKNLKHISSKYLYARLAYQEQRMLFVYCKTDFFSRRGSIKLMLKNLFLTYMRRRVFLHGILFIFIIN